MTTYTFRHPTDAILGYALEMAPLPPADLRRARVNRHRRDAESERSVERGAVVARACLAPTRYVT